MTDFFDGVPPVEPSAANGFTGGGLERRSENRSAETLTQALDDNRARFYLLRGEEVLLNGPDPLFDAAAAKRLGALAGDMVLLGWKDGSPRLAVGLPAIDGDSTPAKDEPRAHNLRALAVEGLVAGDHLGALALARGLTGWHARHGFCANCGAATNIALGGFRRDCPGCGTMHFPRTDPVVIMLTVDGDRALLGRSAHFQPGMYSCLAGFMEPGETVEEAVRRETVEESGIRLGRVRYFSSQPWPFPSSLMIGCHAEALSTEISLDDDELEDCRWFERDEVRAMLDGSHGGDLKAPAPMAIAHHLMAVWALR
jgi:NAD+ diphosphatase